MKIICIIFQVEDVCAFIQTIPDCQVYVDVFRHNEIDGEALVNLSEEQMMNLMHVKLGKAIKIRVRAANHIPSVEDGKENKFF